MAEHKLLNCLTNPAYSRIVHGFAVGYCLLLIFTVLYTCIHLAYPVVYKDSWAMTCNTVFLLFVFFNIIGNYALGMVYSSFFTTGLLLTDPPKSWRFCDVCNQHCPPRCHHCSVCNSCILKHDHHCFFLCQCVGLRNQRYFIIYALYVAIGSLYAVKVLLSYLHIVYVPLQLTFYSISSYMLHGLLYNWFLTETEVTWSAIVCLLVIYGCLSTGMGCLFLFVIQCALVLKGQTLNEYMKKIKPYRSDYRTNFIQVFGPRWFVHFLLPIPTSSHEEKSPWGIPTYYKSV